MLSSTVEQMRGTRSLARWLTFRTNEELVELAHHAKPTRAGNPDIDRVTRLFMSQEGFNAIRNGQKEVSVCRRRLGECASAEYAMRQGWLEHLGYMTLRRPPSEAAVASSLGVAMVEIMGRRHPLTAVVARAPRAGLVDAGK